MSARFLELEGLSFGFPDAVRTLEDIDLVLFRILGANPEEAARLAVKHAIDGSDPALNLDVIRLRNAATVSPLTQRLGLGAMDLPSLQAAADAYRKLGLIERPIRMADVVVSDLLPGK